MNRDEILEGVKGLAEKLGRKPSTTEIQSEGVCAISTLYRYFDSYKEVCEKLGFEPDHRCKPDNGEKYEPDVIRFNYLKLSRELGRPATVSDIAECDDLPHHKKIYQTFGGMPELREAVGLECQKWTKEKIINAIQEKAAMDSGFAKQRIAGNPAPQKTTGYFKEAQGGSGFDKFQDDGYRNKRSVWTVTAKPYKEAHFATYPEALIVPCILAGSPEVGTVLDPFFGSGTTGLVAYEQGRKFIGIDISEMYLRDIAIPRIEKETQQLRLFA